MGEGLGFYKEYVAGMMAGLATVAVGHPFDTVKVKLQKHNTDVQGLRYKNGLHCASRILQTEGVYFPSLFHSTILQTNLVLESLDFSSVDGNLQDPSSPDWLDTVFVFADMKSILGQRTLCGSNIVVPGNGYREFIDVRNILPSKAVLAGNIGTLRDDGDDEPRPEIIVPSAMFGGAIISFVLCPTELVKCRMQIQGTDSLVPNFHRYTSPLDCAVQTVKNEGVIGIFRGGSATLLRECAGNAVFFSVYESLRYHIHSRLEGSKLKDGYLVDMGIGVITGGLGGIACWSAILPLDVAKTIIQTSPDKATETNPLKVLRSIHKTAGLKGCYAGLGPTIVRAFPANAAAIVAWELSMKMLGIKRDQD